MFLPGFDFNSNRCICGPLMPPIVGPAMNRGKLVFAQIMEHLPLTTFRRWVARYDGERKVKRNRNEIPRLR